MKTYYLGCEPGDPDLHVLNGYTEAPSGKRIQISQTFIPRPLERLEIKMPDEQQMLEEAARIAEDDRSGPIFDAIFDQCEGGEFDPHNPSHQTIYEDAISQVTRLGFSPEGSREYVNERLEEITDGSEGEA